MVPSNTAAKYWSDSPGVQDYVARRSLSGTVQLDGVSDFKEHALRRKPWNKAMSSAAIKTYEPTVKSKVRELIDALGKRAGEEVNISDWISFYG